MHVTPYAGKWYPGDAAELRELTTQLFEESERRTGRYLVTSATAFVVPHAGLAYSGVVAASVYRHLRAAGPGCIVVLGFSHHGSPRGCWIPEVEAYGTPLGDMAVDLEACDALAGSGAFRRMPEAPLCDHSIEIQLPLLIEAAPAAKIVPVYVSRVGAEDRRAAAESLAALVRTGAVLLASSDFTHYGPSFRYTPFPSDRWTGERLRDLDLGTIEAAGSLDAEIFLDSIRSTGSTVCGAEPISLLLETVRRLDAPDQELFQETLDYQTSGEITGDYSHSVSYAALGYFTHRALELEPGDQQLLLASVYQTLRRYSETGERKPVPPERITPGLERRATAFVTLHCEGRLRGCVGRRPNGQPLAEIVPELALSAALDDSRFVPLDRSEREIQAEISILTPMKRIADRGAFRVNEHGALLESGYHHGLLLPQVASERDWTAAQFFDALARKAGASSKVYSDPATRLFVFRAQIVR